MYQNPTTSVQAAPEVSRPPATGLDHRHLPALLSVADAQRRTDEARFAALSTVAQVQLVQAARVVCHHEGYKGWCLENAGLLHSTCFRLLAGEVPWPEEIPHDALPG